MSDTTALAHEIAHFLLHRKLSRLVLATEKDFEISDTARELALDQLASDNPRTWVEWQANRFASSLLLPRFTVQAAVFQKQTELGVTRNLGTILLDRQRDNYEDFRQVLRHLQNIFEVSGSAIRIRLRELKILIEHGTRTSIRPNGPEPLRNILPELRRILEE